jgi:hypothetical protein
VILRRDRVADVVQQSGDHHLFIGAVAMRTRRGLQRMLEAVDLVAHEVAGEQRQMRHQPVGQGGAEGAVMPLQELVFLACAVGHVDEVDGAGIHCASPLGRIPGAA